ncbi:tRNA pseudouridine synthase A [Owenweeksia hongkongensis]|uniref:tRNA pseudouridine synthase A n=1 Tax=Owenweeksia hongkongensis TaxID=253245 RepID=UPI003A918A6E
MTKYYYLIRIQYLGFRYHGWATQKHHKTVQSMVDKTVAFVLGHDDFRTMGGSRTDSKVSANEMAFQLFTKEPLDCKSFLKDFDTNLPTDIRALCMEEVDSKFNIIQAPRLKEYLYLFSFGEKAHPFSASLVSTFPGNLDIELMKQGAKLYKGMHNFKAYCASPKENQQFTREILLSQIEENSEYTASFFPKDTYVFKVQGKGFLRYQIRLMMAQLVRLGRNEITLDEMKQSLNGENEQHIPSIAPASALILQKTVFNSSSKKDQNQN